MDESLILGSSAACSRCRSSWAHAGGPEHNAKAFSAALFLAPFVIPTARRIGARRCVIITYDAQVVENVRRKASPAPSPIGEQFIEVGRQSFRFRPHRRDEIGDARVDRKSTRLNSS